MRRILVVGELNTDLIMSGLPSLPILGQESLGTGLQMTMGSSSIIAARLAALGAPVDSVGQVGGDDLGRFVLRESEGFGVGVGHIRILLDAHTDLTIALTYEHNRALLTVACGPQAVTQVAGAANASTAETISAHFLKASTM